MAYAEDLELELATARRFHRVEVDSISALLEIERRYHTMDVDALRRQLPRWYEDPRLQFLAGFLTCSLVVHLVVR